MKGLKVTHIPSKSSSLENSLSRTLLGRTGGLNRSFFGQIAFPSSNPYFQDHCEAFSVDCYIVNFNQDTIANLPKIPLTAGSRFRLQEGLDILPIIPLHSQKYKGNFGWEILQN